jgi:hypothetical protein
MSLANHAVRRSFCPQITPNLTFQMVLNLGKDHLSRAVRAKA